MDVHLSNVLAIIVVATILVVCVSALDIIICCTTQIKAWWHSRPVVLFRLGGITTLRRSLSYPCTMCRDTMEAGDKVRTLSCGHVFHCGATVNCRNDIDLWLRTAPEMSCPLCRQIPHPVLPWKRPPPSSPATSSSASATSDLEEALLLPVLPPPSSPAPSSSASESTTSDLEEALLLPVHWFDEALPETSSSARAPPLAQSPPTSTSDLEEVLPLPVHDETLPEASSSQ